MQRVEADVVASMSDLKKSPARFMEEADGSPVAILDHNRVVAYVVPAQLYETMLERLDDLALADIAKARAGEKGIPVDVHEL